MERNPYSQSENADSKNSTNKDKKSEGFRVAPFPIPGLAENKFRAEPAPERHRPALPPLEGIISWRDQDEIKHSIISADEGTREKKDETQEKDKEKHEKKPLSKEYVSPVEQRQVTPRPLSEVIAEQHSQKESDESDDEEDADTDSVVPAIQARLPHPDFEPPITVSAEHETELDNDSDTHVRLPQPSFTPPQRLADFPTVAPRTELQQPTNQGDQETADESYVAEDEPPIPAGAVHDTLPMQGPGVAEQQELQDDNEDDVAQPPATQQPQFAQAYAPTPQVNGVNNLNQPPINPNNQNPTINPAAWNQMPNPNVVPPVNGMAAMGNGNVPPPLNPNAFGGNAGGNQPPATPGYYNQPPINPNNPVFGYNQAPDPNVSPSIPVMPIEHPAVTYNRDPRVGTVAAALGLEWFARRRADRKLEKRVNERADEHDRKQQKQTDTDNLLARERQRQFNTEQRRQADELYRMRQSQQEYSTSAPSSAEYVSPGLPKPFEASPQAKYTTASTTSHPGAMRPLSGNPERPGMPMQAQEVRVMQQRGEHPQDAEIIEAQGFEPQNAHVEHSSWHNIVVDERGHEVAGAIQYGEGFKRERQQEIIQDSMGDSVTSGNGVSSNPAGGSGSAGSSSFTGGGISGQGIPTQVVYDQYGRPVHMQGLPSGMTNPALQTGQPTHVDPQHQLAPTNKQPANITNPWFWIMLLLIIAAFFTAALV
jgi:hypothetical protein